MNPKAQSSIVAFTALLGGRDALSDQPSRPPIDWVCFSDQPPKATPYRWTAIVDHFGDPRRSSRDYKIRPHRVLPEVEISLWHDANMQFIGTDLLGLLIDGLRTHPIVLTRHPERHCAYAEAEWCIAHQKDRADRVQKTVQRLRAEGLPEGAGLLNGGLIARRNRDPRVIAFNECWWEYYQSGSERDQISLVHALRQTGLEPLILESDCLEPPFLSLHPHRL